MAGKINIYLNLHDEDLREKVVHLISDDWTMPWNIIGPDPVHPECLADFQIAVIDRKEKTKRIPPSVPVVFCGRRPGGADAYFAVVPKSSAEDIFLEIRRAYSHYEITVQNRESLVPQLEKSENLASLAQALSAKVNQLIRQSEMRIALVDQLPVGVLGIDDENNVVLANPKAIEILSVEDVPIWGMPIDHLLSRDVRDFLYDYDRKMMEYNRYENTIILWKSQFLLDEKFAGTILVLIGK